MSDETPTGQTMALARLSVLSSANQAQAASPGRGERTIARHLVGRRLPQVTLESYDGGVIPIRHLSGERIAFYFYPGTNTPPAEGIESPESDVAQHLAFREHQRTMEEQHVRPVGISSQSSVEQRAAIIANRLTHTLLSDSDLALADALGLPTFEHAGRRWYRRPLLLVRNEVIEWALYPATSPSRTPTQVLAWLQLNGCDSSPTPRDFA
jgi:peroxiredoxin